MNTTQILQRVEATLSFALLDQNGQPREAPAGVVAAVVRANGTLLSDDPIDTGLNSDGEVTIELTAEQTAELDRLTVQLLEGDTVIAEFPVEIVGGYYFTIDEARDSSPSLNNIGLYSDELLMTARHVVEEEAERICGRAFVPRHGIATLSGDGSAELMLPHPDLRRIRSLMVADRAFDVDALGVGPSDMIVSVGERFPRGSRNVVVEYEYGLDAPPQRVKSAALLRLRDVAEFTKTGVSGRNLYEVVDGQVFGVAQPGVRGSRTGNPEVDQAYNDWSLAHVAIA